MKFNKWALLPVNIITFFLELQLLVLEKRRGRRNVKFLKLQKWAKGWVKGGSILRLQ